MVALVPAQDGNDGGAAQPRELHWPLRGEPKNWESLKIIGEAAHVRFEAEGMRITLPADPAKGHPDTGLVIHRVLKGDFDATVTFEMLFESNPKSVAKQATKLSLLAHLDTPQTNFGGALRRTAATQATDFVARAVQWNPAREKKAQKFKAFPTTAKVGRLRLERRDAVLSCYAAEGLEADFGLLHGFEIGAEDAKEIHLVASTGGPNGSIDVRVSDLRIRAMVSREATVEPAPSTSRRPMIVALFLGLGMGVTILGIWLYQRRRQR